ncbi:MFS transporter [Peribacillus kribbensis]|uniref:MFS transporter n=1 Tax=Peribacillus kribbensis TaxID=356658 RepID=UPI0004186043|nr:MFS transporter [Peribacillus kribbensis]
MTGYSRSFKALLAGEIVSEFGGTAGGIINGLLLYDITGSREWLGAVWLVYFIPSLALQFFGAPFLNRIKKGKALRNIQLIRGLAYLFPFAGYFSGSDAAAIAGLVVLQSILGLLQPLYASLSFSLLPDICSKSQLADANGLIDGVLRLMNFLAPGAASLLLMALPMQGLYIFTCAMFLLSFLSLLLIRPEHEETAIQIWSKKFWWQELKEGYKTFFTLKALRKFTFLSSAVQFAVGASMVLSVPFIKGELGGESWQYALFSGSFPIGYTLGMILLAKLPKTNIIMYAGLAGGGLSFVLLSFVHSVYAACLCELAGGLIFPLFNANSASLFQQEAPKERLPQLSSVRLLFLRVTMPLGLLFASADFIHLTARNIYFTSGSLIVLPGIFYCIKSVQKAKEFTPAADQHKES